ncbi:hypothetical protein CUROG_00500 [Corynebacterium urogenitale]|uniref:Uncharacterized protein n=1 Tax=Corynebacterium urogenitale TaxID=2487892 RepID=A0A5J6Z3E7_9CORY|nr:hypothetical protein CUROG_00500 [Corynebacterium urogenitale]
MDDNDIAFTGLIQCLVQSGAGGGGSEFLINVNVFAGNTFLAQSVDLSVKVLFTKKNSTSDCCGVKIVTDDDTDTTETSNDQEERHP